MRKGPELWRLARQRFLESVQEAVRIKRERLNRLRETVLELVRAGKVVVTQSEEDAKSVPAVKYVACAVGGLFLEEEGASEWSARAHRSERVLMVF